jgi:hypothetical protein
MAAGCAQSEPASQPASAAVVPAPEAQKYLLASEPAGAQGVIDVRKNVQSDDQVTVVGRIGGDANPWVDGRVAFLIVDSSLKPCNEIEGDSCSKPWDYCCEADLAGGKAMVKLLDEQAQPIQADAKTFLAVKELDTVVVTGRAQRDEAGNVTILADKVFVRR